LRSIGLQYWIYIVMVFAGTSTCMAQTHWIDSLKNELKKLPEDSVRLFIYTQLGNQYFSYDTLLSAQYLEKGYAIAKKLRWDYAIGDYYQIRGGLKQYSSDNGMAGLYLDSAIFFYEQSIKKGTDIIKMDDAKLSIATCLGQKADLLADMGKPAEAIPAYISALEAWKASDDYQKDQAIAIFYEKIATAYYNQKLYEKSLIYDKLYLSLSLTGNNQEAKAHAYTYVSDDFIALKKVDSALAYLNMGKPIVLTLNNHRINLQYYNKLGQIAVEKKEYRQAIPYFEKAVAEAIFTNAKQPKANNERMIALCYSRMGDYTTSRKYLLMALPTATTGKYVNDRISILQDLVTTEDKDHRPAIAYAYLKQLVALKDSINSEETKTKITEIENKYQASEKEKKIIQLQSERNLQTLSLKKTSTYNYFLIALLSAMFIAALLAYRIIRHRNVLAKKETELQQQHIRELEKDRQLVAVDSMLKGQEEERSRLAKDLHDGLGGLLSGVKFSLRNMKDNLIITPDNMIVFERSLDMLDTSIKELRRVAHNMMPELLTKFGLDEALKEYCNTVNATNLLSVKYQSVGMTTRIEKSSEIIIYRIIQELLNNIMKHAAATEAVVQLIKDEHRFSLIVEDNGKGFDTAILKNNKGAGLTSIQSRVDYLKGRVEIHSNPAKGTLVNIEFNSSL
jgi:two-component system, NarL family, sensor kinase